jgi:ABC-type sugar transport system ATPase subunit
MSALSLRGISKSFFGVPALRDATLDLGSGRVLGLVGQNGAGKSTLMNVLGGVHRPDAGTMAIDGIPYAPTKPADAKARGIAFIHQELNLFSNLSIAENIFIGDFPRRGGFIDTGRSRDRAAEMLRAVDLDMPPTLLVERLSPGERQLVEVAKALEADARTIIFDEPTTSLTARETARLFDLIRRLRAEGKTIIYISHVLADVRALADDIAVLRDGEVVGTGPAASFDTARMINLMLGRDIAELYPPRSSAASAEVLLEIRGISATGVLRDVSLDVHRGEIVGIFGLMGSGRTELARMIFGLDRFEAGVLTIGGRTYVRITPLEAIGAGLAFVTENRREEGLLMDVSIAGNLVLAALRRFVAGPGLMQDELALDAAATSAARLAIKAGAIAIQPAKTLSGGNQQKVVLGKWLMAEPELIILDEPTRGIDIAARFEIYTMIDRLAADGRGILFISSEIEEVVAMSDRVLVMSRGEIVEEFRRPDLPRDAILRAAFRETEEAA